MTNPAPTQDPANLRRWLADPGNTNRQQRARWLADLARLEAADNPILQAALSYARRKWYVFPCREKPGPKNKEKSPYTPHGIDDATTDPATIAAWWKEHPQALIGIDPDKSGLAVIDLDVKHGKNGPATWAALGIDDAGGLHSRTASGGNHIVFKAPAGVQLKGGTDKLGDGVDVQVGRKYFIAPPSVIAEGEFPSAYTALDDWDREPAALPQAVVMLLTRADPKAAISTNGNGHKPQGIINPKDEIEKARGALGRLDPWRCDDHDEWIRVGLSLTGLGEAGLTLWDEWSQKSPKYQPGECARRWATFDGEGLTIASLHKWANDDNPRTTQAASDYTPPAPDNWEVGDDNFPPAPEVQQKPGKKGSGGERATPGDPELAGRWMAAHPLTAWGMGEFRRYAGGIWSVLNIDAARDEIQTVLEAAAVEGVKPTSWLRDRVLEYARIRVRVADETWDANLDILTFPNGTLHIPTRQLLPHDPSNYTTYSLPFDYDPLARADVWDYVLNTCACDAKDFLQEFFGYALTVDTRHEIALWLYSPPGGGKSTILTGGQAMLGQRAGLLGLADIEKSRFALTGLPGKTLVVSAEQPGGYMMAAHYLNAIISGEPITVDRKFKDPVTIVPRAKLAWAMNELPRVGEAGSGLFRRVKVLQLPVIPERDRDPEVKERIKTEGAGILNWALDGLERLRARGKFDIPACVKDATDQFRQSNDIPAAFVAEKCLTGREYSTQGSLLYAAYKDWCVETGHKYQSSTSIAIEWRRLGFEKYMGGGRSYWRGVGLVTIPATTTEGG